MNHVESCIRSCERGEWSDCVPLHLRTLTRYAGSSPLAHIRIDTWVVSSGSLCCALAIASKFTTGDRLSWNAFSSIRDRASATGFSLPPMCRMSPVNWDMKSRWRICCGECWLECDDSACVKGLWSNTKLATFHWKCLMEIDSQKLSIRSAVSGFGWF